MLALSSPESLTVAVAAALHHLAIGADGTGLSLWSFAGLWHVMTTVLVPAVLVAVSVVLMLFTPPPSRAPADERLRPPTMVLSMTHGAGAPGDGERRHGEPRQSEREAEQAVTRFYRVTFADERGFRMWVERVVEFAGIVRDLIGEHVDLRPVIFVPLRVTPGAPLHAYVSAGARALAARISGGATVEPQPIGGQQLPRGLTMLFGDGVDAAEYERGQG